MRFASYVALIFVVLAAPAFAADGKPPFEITGKVLLPDGSPAAGAVVDTWYPRNTTGATADSSGTFKMSLKPGEYYFRVSLKTFAGKEREPVKVKKDGTLSKPIELRLEQGCMVTGKLTDKSTGKPIASAKILTREYDTAITQEDGTFAFPALPKANYEATILKDGCYRPVFGFTTAGGDTLDLPLETKPDAVIKGRVTNEKGEPIKGASLGPSGTYFDFQRVKTDENGCFVLAGFDPDGRVEEVWVSAGGYEDQRKENLTFPAGQRELTMDFVMQPKKIEVRNITGRVMKADGVPIEGAKVSYGFSSSYGGYKSVSTDKDGAYELKGVSQGKNLVVVQCKGYAPAFGFAEEKVDAKLDFKLQSGHRVAGKIVDEKGKPIQGVQIATMAQTDAMDRMNFGRDAYRYLDPRATTGKDGRFELADLPADGLLVDVYTAKDFTDKRNMPLKVDKLDHVIVLQPHGEIRGKVVAAKDGKPVKQFEVFTREWMEHGTKFNAPDGTFTIGGLGMGESRQLTIEAAGFCRESVANVEAKRKGTADPNKMVLKLKPAVQFEGTVTGTGAPIEGATITILDASGRAGGRPIWSGIPGYLRPVTARTDAQGRFSVECPMPGGTVMVQKPGWGHVGIAQVNLRKPLDVSMEKAASISGVVLDESGKPVSKAHVSVRTLDTASEHGEASTSPDGRFRLGELPAGELVVDALLPGRNRSAKAHCAEVRAGEDYVVDWNAPTACTVEGVVTLKGKPVAGAHLSAHPEGKCMFCAAGESGPDGSYRLSIPKPGSHGITAGKGEYRRPDYVSIKKQTAVKPGVNRLDIALPAGVVSGVVRDPKTKKPASGVTVTAYRRAWEREWYGWAPLWMTQHTGPIWMSQKTAQTDQSGRFEVVTLEPGEWTLSANLGPGKGSLRSAPFRLGSDEEKRGVVLEAGKCGSAEIAAVDAGTGKPVDGAFVICVGGSGPAFLPERDPAKPGG